MGPVNPWVGVNDPDNGPPPTALQGQVMGSPPAAMGGAGGGVIANGVSPGIGIPGGGVGGSVGGISVQQQQQQQQQAALVSGHVPAMMAGGGMVYGYPYPGEIIFSAGLRWSGRLTVDSTLFASSLYFYDSRHHWVVST